MDLLCEELEITDDLIGKLTKEALVNNDIVKRMKQTKTRAGRIKYLLTHIKTPKKG